MARRFTYERLDRFLFKNHKYYLILENYLLTVYWACMQYNIIKTVNMGGDNRFGMGPGSGLILLSVFLPFLAMIRYWFARFSRDGELSNATDKFIYINMVILFVVCLFAPMTLIIYGLGLGICLVAFGTRYRSLGSSLANRNSSTPS